MDIYDGANANFLLAGADFYFASFPTEAENALK